MRYPVVWPVQEVEPNTSEQQHRTGSEAPWLRSLDWVLSLVVFALGMYALFGSL